MFIKSGLLEATIKKLTYPVLTILIFSLFTFRIWQTTGCRQFLDRSFTTSIIKARVEEQVNIDSALNRNLSRLFHNKLTVGFMVILERLASEFEPRYLLEVLSPAGFVLLILATSRLISKRETLVTAHFASVLLTSLLPISQFQPKIGFLFESFTRMLFCLWGLKYFSQRWYFAMVFILLVVVSFWYYSFSWQLKTFCNEIFFN